MIVCDTGSAVAPPTAPAPAIAASCWGDVRGRAVAPRLGGTVLGVPREAAACCGNTREMHSRGDSVRVAVTPRRSGALDAWTATPPRKPDNVHEPALSFKYGAPPPPPAGRWVCRCECSVVLILL